MTQSGYRWVASAMHVICARASRAGPRGATGGNLLLLVDKLTSAMLHLTLL
jgi:hypothetical protein